MENLLLLHSIRLDSLKAFFQFLFVRSWIFKFNSPSLSLTHTPHHAINRKGNEDEWKKEFSDFLYFFYVPFSLFNYANFGERKFILISSERNVNFSCILFRFLLLISDLSFTLSPNSESQQLILNTQKLIYELKN